MGTPFDEQHSVWTDHNDPAWIARNTVPAMVITDGLSLERARFTCERLRKLMPGNKFYIKNTRGEVVDTFETRPAITTPGGPQTRRRPLGSRE